MYDPVQYEKFKTVAAKEQNFKDYLNEHISYVKVFLACLNLFSGEKSKEHIPRLVQGEIGRLGAKD